MAKHKCPECDEGAPLWALTFGDMMSLLLCFFVMLFAMSEIKQPKFELIIGSIREYRGKFTPHRPVHDPRDVPGATEEKIMESAMGEEKDGGAADARTIRDMAEKVQTLRTTPPLTLVLAGATTFELNSNEVLPGGYADIAEFAEQIRGYNNRRITIVGHSASLEDSPEDDPGNFDLGHRRAMSILNRLVHVHGLNERQFELGTAGRYNPPKPGSWDPGDTQQDNRRVEIRISAVPYYKPQTR